MRANWSVALARSSCTDRNEFYPDEERLLYAIADVMRDEYEAIANTDYADLSIADIRKIVELHVEALNYSISNISPEQVRIHVCWGNYEGPHHRDIPLQDVIDLVLKCSTPRWSVATM